MESLYPVVFVDAIHYSVKDNGIIRKMAAYVILAINKDGIKEVLGGILAKMKVQNTGLACLMSLKTVDQRIFLFCVLMALQA